VKVEEFEVMRAGDGLRQGGLDQDLGVGFGLAWFGWLVAADVDHFLTKKYGGTHFTSRTTPLHSTPLHHLWHLSTFAPNSPTPNSCMRLHLHLHLRLHLHQKAKSQNTK
jgi:hypothetical protein